MFRPGERKIERERRVRVDSVEINVSREIHKLHQYSPTAYTTGAPFLFPIFIIILLKKNMYIFYFLFFKKLDVQLFLSKFKNNICLKSRILVLLQ